MRDTAGRVETVGLSLQEKETDYCAGAEGVSMGKERGNSREDVERSWSHDRLTLLEAKNGQGKSRANKRPGRGCKQGWRPQRKACSHGRLM